MAEIKDHPAFSNFIQVADHSYVNCLLSSELDQAYRPEITRSVATIFKATGAFPAVDADVAVSAGRSMKIMAVAYMLFGEDVLVNFGITSSPE